MSTLDYLVLLASILGIAAYGVWHTRGRKDLQGYLKGSARTSWLTIGLSVMATQASAVTFLSTPGQGYADGLKFVQFYFGLPIAMVIIAVVFLPLYRRLNVYTAYEFLGRRFDGPTRLLGAGLFLLQRGLGAGITIYAPAIVFSTVLGWSLDLTILLSGILVIVYTMSGGSEAVNVTQKHQMALVFTGLVIAFFVVLAKLPEGVGFTDALRVAGSAGRMQAIDYSVDPNDRYTLWSGLFGSVFLFLAYFGTDQSQVQRYLSGTSLRESRLGLMFNAVVKIPMQFFILLLGVMVFVFYQFAPAPLFFNQTEWRRQAAGPAGDTLRSLDAEFSAVHQEKEQQIRRWLEARHAGDGATAAAARTAMSAAEHRIRELRTAAGKAVTAADPAANASDRDYVFITFVLDHLPHGLIGLLIAVFFAGGLSSISAELNALGSTTTIDLYRHVIRPDASDAHCVFVSKCCTALWGGVALAFAFSFQLAENLIQAVNIIGSLFYGTMLGLFVVAFFFKRVGGRAVFWGAVVAQASIIALHWHGGVEYLWYNPIGCGICVLVSLLIQAWPGTPAPPTPAAS